MLTRTPPLYVAGGAVYAPSRELEALATVETRYGEAYSIGRQNVSDSTYWLPRGACPASVDDRRTDGRAVPYACQFTPRNTEQHQIVDEATELLQAGNNFIVQAPTGWGKTVVGCAIAGRIQRKTLVITTKDDIVEHWIVAARNVLGLDAVDIDLWRGDEVPAPDALFVVGLVQSLAKGPERYPKVDFGDFGLVICDEVHRMGAEYFSQCMWWFPGKLRLGLSATPYRKDGREYVFTSHIGPVRLKATQETKIPRVVVRHSDWRVPRHKQWDPVRQEFVMVMMPHTAGKLGHVTKMLAKSASRNQMIVKFVQAAYRKKRNTIVFSDALEHLYRLHGLLVAAGVEEQDIGYYVGLSGHTYTGQKKSRKAQRELAKTKPVILATYQMASEATDIPWLDACVLAVPRADVVQIVGRIRREYAGKKTPVVLDIVDDDSPVLRQFAKSRRRWYASIGCEVLVKS